MKFGVYIGRFQPFHLAHLATVKHALTMVDQLIILVGSCDARDERNPWRGWERANFIMAAVGEEAWARISIEAVNDRPGDDDAWASAVRQCVDRFTWMRSRPSVTLFGANKDASSYYLSFFHEWEAHDCGEHIASLGLRQLDGTAIRAALRAGDLATVKAGVPPAVFALLMDERTRNEQDTQASNGVA